MLQDSLLCKHVGGHPHGEFHYIKSNPTLLDIYLHHRKQSCIHFCACLLILGTVRVGQPRRTEGNIRPGEGWVGDTVYSLDYYIHSEYTYIAPNSTVEGFF